MHGVYLLYNKGMTICETLKNIRVCTLAESHDEHRSPIVGCPYISALIRPLVEVELPISMTAIQAAVAQITISYSCTYRKAWLPKQRVVADLFDNWVTLYSMLPPYLDPL